MFTVPSARAKKWLIAIAVLLITGLVTSLYLVKFLRGKIRFEVIASLERAGFANATFEMPEASLWGITITDLRAGRESELVIAHLQLRYRPMRAIVGRIDSIKLQGASVTFDLDKPRADRGSVTTALDPTQFSSPADVIEISPTTIVLLKNEEKLRVEFSGKIRRSGETKSDAELVFTVAGAPATFSGAIDTSKRTATLKAAITDVRLAALFPLSPDVVLDYLNSVSGKASIAIDGRFADGKWEGPISLQLLDTNVATIKEIDVAIEGLNVDVQVDDFPDWRCKPGQFISARSIVVSGQTISDPRIRFSATDFNKLSIESLSCVWGGGVISIDGPAEVALNEKSVNGALRIEHLSVQQFLELISQGKSTGSGAVSGTLPIAIRWPRVQFGEGNLSADGTGVLKFGQDVSRIVTDALQSDSRFRKDPQMRQIISEALTSFAYTTLVFDFRRIADELRVSAHVAGKGTAGSRAPIDLTVNYNGVEQLLSTYLSARSRVSVSGN